MKPREFSGITTIIVSADVEFEKSGPTFTGPGLSNGEEFPKIAWIGEGVDRVRLEYTAIDPIPIEITEPGYKSETVVLDSGSPSEIKVVLKRDNTSEQNDDAN